MGRGGGRGEDVGGRNGSLLCKIAQLAVHMTLVVLGLQKTLPILSLQQTFLCDKLQSVLLIVRDSV